LENVANFKYLETTLINQPQERWFSYKCY